MPSSKAVTSKLRGQHFLSDKNVVAKIIAAANLQAGDFVLEVGPGLGVLTREIFPRVGHLVAVELDPFFVSELRREFGSKPVEIVEADILKVRASDLLTSLPQNSGYKLVTNLPYNITSAFLKKFLLERPSPESMVVMIQEEVVDRICEKGEGSSNLLGLSVNLYAASQKLFTVGAGSFAPPPKVTSAVISLKPYSDAEFLAKWGIGREYGEDVLAFAAKFFAQPRKKMAGLLPKTLAPRLKEALLSLEESPDSRPAVLSLGKWVKLWQLMG
jgi:16S rRNA (adenine1518-N6/adenine1519-N6)-dimethyltransferase